MSTDAQIPQSRPEEIRIETRCRKCGALIGAYAAGDCPEEWTQKLAAILTCTACAENRERFVKARETVYAMAKRLEEAKDAAPADWDWIRGRLVQATKDYCCALATSQGMTEAPWTEELVDAIMEHPQKVGVVLGHAVKAIRLAREASRQ